MPPCTCRASIIHRARVPFGDSCQMCQGQGVGSKPITEVEMGPDVLGFRCVRLRSDSTCCYFYIPPLMIKQPADLWPNNMLAVRQVPGLPLSPLLNYYSMAIGWDKERKTYHTSSILDNMDIQKYVKSDDRLASVLWHIAQAMHTYGLHAQALIG